VFGFGGVFSLVRVIGDAIIGSKGHGLWAKVQTQTTWEAA